MIMLLFFSNLGIIFVDMVCKNSIVLTMLIAKIWEHGDISAKRTILNKVPGQPDLFGIEKVVQWWIIIAVFLPPNEVVST